MKFLFIFILLSSNVFAYTLNNNFGASFSGNEVKVTVDELTTCHGLQIQAHEFKSLVEEATKRFWNNVPTSALELKYGGFNSRIININNGILCAPTDDACIASSSNIIAPVRNIVIACNSNEKNFEESENVLAVTVPNNFSGRSIKGAVILLNEKSNIFKNLSRDDKIGVIAHEIGHALGLGHTDDKAALMYYRTVDQRKKLGEDDMRGISYLYPMKLDMGGLLGGCGTITTDTKNPPGNSPFLWMIFSLGGLVFIFELVRSLKRSQARATL